MDDKKVVVEIEEDDDLNDVELGEAACELGEACEACQ